MQSYQRFQHIVHTVFNTSGTNGPCSLSWAKAGTHATPALSRAHSGLHGETGGVLGGGGITTLGAFHTVRKPCVAGCQNGVLCRFWGLVVGAPKERREPSGQRCAYACRCSEALCVLQEHIRPRPKSGKVCRSDTRPGDVRERAARVEGNDSAPVRKARVSACKPLCAIFL